MTFDMSERKYLHFISLFPSVGNEYFRSVYFSLHIISFHLLSITHHFIPISSINLQMLHSGDSLSQIASSFSFLFLFFKKFFLSAYISSIEISRYIFSHSRQIFTCYNLISNRCLKRNSKESSWNYFLEFCYYFSSDIASLRSMYHHRKSCNPFSSYQNIEFYEIISLVFNEFIVHRSISTGKRFQFIIKVPYELIHRKFISQHHSRLIDKLLIHKNSSSFLRKLH